MLKKKRAVLVQELLPFFCFATLFFIIICYLVLLYYPRKRIFAIGASISHFFFVYYFIGIILQ